MIVRSPNIPTGGSERYRSRSPTKHKPIPIRYRASNSDHCKSSTRHPKHNEATFQRSSPPQAPPQKLPPKPNQQSKTMTTQQSILLNSKSSRDPPSKYHTLSQLSSSPTYSQPKKKSKKINKEQKRDIQQ